MGALRYRAREGPRSALRSRIVLALADGTAVPAGAALEARRAGGCLAAGERLEPPRDLVGDRLRPAQVPLLDCGHAVVAHRRLRKGAEGPGKRQGAGERLAILGHLVDKADAQRLLGADGATGQDQLERAAVADDARQTDRAEVDRAGRRNGG